jgi:uncharacterized protein
MNSLTTLILPGLGNSSPQHWQSYWERQDPTCQRVIQAEWDAPHCTDWVTTLGAAVATVAAAHGQVVLVAHSSSCALVAQWVRHAAGTNMASVRGALLVAPSDPDGPNYPVGPTGFGPMPLERLPFPSIVVASTDDMYVTFEQARAYADAWGSTFVSAGPAGHVNTASGLGSWPAGYALLDSLRDRSSRPAPVSA